LLRSIPSRIVLTKLDGTASPECQKSAKKKTIRKHTWLVPMGSFTAPTTKVKVWYLNHEISWLVPMGSFTGPTTKVNNV